MHRKKECLEICMYTSSPYRHTSHAVNIIDYEFHCSRCGCRQCRCFELFFPFFISLSLSSCTHSLLWHTNKYAVFACRRHHQCELVEHQYRFAFALIKLDDSNDGIKASCDGDGTNSIFLTLFLLLFRCIFVWIKNDVF